MKLKRKRTLQPLLNPLWEENALYSGRIHTDNVSFNRDLEDTLLGIIRSFKADRPSADTKDIVDIRNVKIILDSVQYISLDNIEELLKGARQNTLYKRGSPLPGIEDLEHQVNNIRISKTIIYEYYKVLKHTIVHLEMLKKKHDL